ncbi:proton-conducting transporter transmembrane domain-containing protein [Hoyosella subflava]|uniref:Formate hydrogenlyase subunit 3/multisubunit Na+/H+ antiporter, MnhD subunit n=1 Tax=Hoyosella subflava (strain DSM 45089 / JCM 17490 / NBRC 109087 / DQS3-9A1) TaxID=443218 RepID=F6EIU1_HOYSD|nr:proton-conducting transporter membrane subunit [Hoyosella subflava]AEF40002.1 Formate hydrogenlyase subunit 3/multisubunit Na+/H+ antiporter, MnhD subunit [Hoyosella subflava DQS3-9A1]
MIYQWIPLVILALSLVPATIIFFLRDDQHRPRTGVNMAGATLKVVLVFALIPFAVAGETIEFRAPFVPGIDFLLRIDPFALYFLTLSSVLWFLTTIYAIGYLENSPHRSRFFAFFSLCVTATSGIALSGNLVTFLVFYELLTLATYPLVAHRQTPEALAGARTYLRYTMAGGVVLLLGVVWLTAVAGPVEFADRGSPQVAELAHEQPGTAALIFGLLIAGLAVKAALVPLHTWLPKAMVAPTPVSALLHAVAVVKAGVFGIALVVNGVFGVEVARELGVLAPLSAIAAITIVYGSVQALRQDGIKARLAYSTVSQLSYIALGLTIPSVIAMTGAVAHIVNQGLMKITLFFCAGLLAETLGVKKFSQLSGLGRRMPLTCAAFTVGALGMIGLPPVAGFVSKWYLGLGALEADQAWILGILLLSSILNAAYFLPAVYSMWWGEPQTDPGWNSSVAVKRTRLEAAPALLIPTMATAGLAVAVGVFAGLDVSSVELARVIAERFYA